MILIWYCKILYAIVIFNLGFKFAHNFGKYWDKDYSYNGWVHPVFIPSVFLLCCPSFFSIAEEIEQHNGEQDWSDSLPSAGTHWRSKPTASPLHHLPIYLHYHPGGESGDDPVDSHGLSAPHFHVHFSR